MKLQVCFLWHMHQPYYRDPETGHYILPWVRLHAIKDYVALPRIFREFPAIRHTFNLVPSLLKQLRDYVEKGAQDTFLAVSRKHALDLTREDESFLLKNFFSAYPPTMILPHPRYGELYRGRERAMAAAERPGSTGGFGSSDFNDLVTLFNLAWFHPIHREEDRELSRIWRKEGGYTEREKQYVLDRQLDLMAEVIPEYRKLVERDGGELSASPLYHPILPLVIDNRAAQEALPGAPLPRLPFSYPEDAWEQIRQGRGYLADLFGREPEGMWPSEGSVSPKALELMARAGFRWAATDEILLARSLGKHLGRDPSGVPDEPGWVYLPYHAQTPSGPIHLFFRDHHLSDLIGFEYSRWDPVDAAKNFTYKIKMIYNKCLSIPSHLRKESYIVPVILDGENAWEYFPDSGTLFLKTLLSKLSNLPKEIQFNTFSGAIDSAGYSVPLPSLPTGSWIDGTFGIWIGHREDHSAWEMLSQARNLWQRRFDRTRAAGLTDLSEDLQAAREHLFVAEGSDWCWWYGDDHYTPHGPEFDRLFRHHVKAAYRTLGEKPPDSLDIPILREDRMPSKRNLLESPRSFIRPKINGKLTSYFEWSAATRYFPSPEYGTMHRAGIAILSCLYYGFDESTLYFRIDFAQLAFETGVPVEIEFLFPGKDRKVSLTIYPETREFHGTMGPIGESPPTSGQAVPSPFLAGFHKVLEVGIPFLELSCDTDPELEFFLTLKQKGTVGERWPMFGSFRAGLPGADFEQKNWRL